MDFETATDLDLEQALACLVYKCDGWELSKTGGSFHSCGIDGSASYVQPIPKYCTDISATWPLMIEHGISVSPAAWGKKLKNPSLWLATNCEGDFYSEDNSPLRVIVICLIKVLEAKHERT